MKSYILINIMNRLFEQMIVNPIRKEKNYLVEHATRGIYFKIEIDIECFGYEKDGNTYHEEWRNKDIQYFHVLMVYPHSVYTQITTDFSRFDNDIPQNNWKNTSNHDSCWQNGCDELISLTFSMWDKVFAKVPHEHFPDDKDTNIHMSLGNPFNNVFDLVTVKTEPDYKLNKSGYFNKVISIIK